MGGGLPLTATAGDVAGHEAGLPPVISTPRRTGRNGSGAIRAPASAAMLDAAASACWVASPPCLIGNAVPSPAAQTPVESGDLPVVAGQDEAVRFVGGKTRDARAHDAREGHDAIDLELAGAGLDRHHSPGRVFDVGAADELDARGCELLAPPPGHARPRRSPAARPRA